MKTKTKEHNEYCNKRSKDCKELSKDYKELSEKCRCDEEEK